MAEASEKRWTIRKTATVSFITGLAIWLVGWVLEADFGKTATPLVGAGIWVLKYVLPTLATIGISFFFLGRQRPDRMGALKGATLGAVAGPVAGWLLGFVLILIPVLGWALIPLTGLVGRLLSAYLSAAGTMMGEFKDEKK